jgi:hypothetical protein
MSNIKIFRANRGEGKTKWLVERAKECAEEGRQLYYVGNLSTFDGVKSVYEATYCERCPIKYGNMEDVTRDYCFFTDEFIDNTRYIVDLKPFIVENGCDWYITMSKEDFVN